MQIPALMPMKGYSERIPNKNMKLFEGKPLYHKVANLLQISEMISKIVIDTDSDIIAEDALNNFSKVQIIKRPPNLCGDMVSMESIIGYDIGQLDENHFFQSFSTCPLLSLKTVETAIKTYFDLIYKYDSLFSVTKIQKRLYWGTGKPINHDPSILRTQDIPPVFERNACIYIFSKKSFFDAGGFRIGKIPKMFQMDDVESIDIDVETDFLIAELLYRHIYS